MTQRTRVIALEWNVKLLIDVLVELSTQHGWDPIYCVSYGLEGYFKQHFPAGIYHEVFDARFGRPAPALADMQLMMLDQPEAEALGYVEVNALKQMNRMEMMGGFATHDRFLHFHRLAGYWSAVLDRLKPDVLLMPTAPHAVYDYIAYTLAKRREIRTAMFEYVTTDGRLVAIDSFEDGLPPVVARFRELRASLPAGPVVLSDKMEAYWQRLRGTYEQAIPIWTKQLLAGAEVLRAAEEKERAEEAAAAESAAQARPLPKPPGVDGHYRSCFYKASETPDGLAREAAQYRRSHAESVRRRYDDLAVPPDLGQPYVYVALHMQPERSTNPIGGVFDDQNVMIGLIAQALPAGWKIYVKEHPSQLLPQWASERGRWASLYDAILHHRVASLVPRHTPSFDLIDNARAVATITGTSSWEALVRGIPTLVFGEAWYKGCPGSYTIRTRQDCSDALTRIAAGERPDPEAVRLFLRAAQDSSFVGYLGPDDEPIANIDEATNISRLVHAIVECYGAHLSNTSQMRKSG